MGFTTDYANSILKNLVSSAYIALATEAPSGDSTGSSIVEPSTDANYARVELNTTNGNFAAEDCELTNKAYIYFAEATENWGYVKYLCIVNAKEGGTLRYYGALNSAKNGGAGTLVEAEHVPLFKDGSISISLDAD